MSARHELFYHTEATLRLVDHELSEHHAVHAVHAAPDVPETRDAPRAAVAPLSGLAALPLILERALAEIEAVLASLRDNRTALETATVEKLQRTSDKLREVTTVTEVAATDILDALERAQRHVDELDACDESGDRGHARATRDLLREELFAMMGCLQFQDITTQQLAYASSVLTDMENRLLAIARLFDPAATLARTASAAPDPRTYAPDATALHAEERQALADEIFAR